LPLSIVSVAEELSPHETDSGPGPTIRLTSAQTRNRLAVVCAVDSHRLSEDSLSRLELSAWGYELQLSDAQTQEHEP
jgi:hypothetical protein